MYLQPRTSMVRHYTSASSQRSRWQVSDLCKQGRVQEALLEYEARPHPIGAVALLNAIKATSGLSDKTNLERALHVWSVLSKRASTQTPSEELPNVQVFGALIATCCHFGDRSLALKFFELMDSYQVRPNSQCFGILANACAKAGDTKIARMLLNQIMDNKLLFSPNEIDCVQLAMAFCKGVPPELEAALRLFDWVTQHTIALKSSTLHTVLLDGCAIGRDLALAMRVFEHFQQIFARRSVPADIRTVGAMLKVYGNCGQHIKALELLDRMESDFGLAPNERCFGLVAQACTQAEDGSTTAKELLARVMDNKLSLIPSGPQCTQLAQALSSSPTTLASAVQLFDWARSRKVDLTSAITTVILKGCTQWVAANLGRQFYANIHALYGNNWDDRVDGALVSFFGKCGTTAEAREVFDNARKAQAALSIHVWTAMLGVYGQRGQGRAALQLFGEMVQSGIKPDSVTLIAALNACSHAGLVDEALDLARSMRNQWGIQLDTAQGTCVVDALARAGRLEEAESFALQLANPDEATWRALLGACRGYR
jgi:pentatricopeptide repeat protein